MALIVLAFVCLGFLIGNLVGLSAESTLAVLIPLLFTFAGGSAVAFLPKLDVESRRLAAAAVIALSLSCMAGVYSGIFVSEHQLLSPSSTRASSSSTRSIAENKYLKSINMRDVDAIHQQFRTNRLTAEQAYNQLHELVSKGDTP